MHFAGISNSHPKKKSKSIIIAHDRNPTHPKTPPAQASRNCLMSKHLVSNPRSHRLVDLALIIFKPASVSFQTTGCKMHQKEEKKTNVPRTKIPKQRENEKTSTTRVCVQHIIKEPRDRRRVATDTHNLNSRAQTPSHRGTVSRARIERGSAAPLLFLYCARRRLQ